MGPFRWPTLQHDVDLAKEVVATRPEKPIDWDNIASRLNPIFSLTIGKAVDLKGRSCRERMERLIKKYKSILQPSRGKTYFLYYDMIANILSSIKISCRNTSLRLLKCLGWKFTI